MDKDLTNTRLAAALRNNTLSTPGDAVRVLAAYGLAIVPSDMLPEPVQIDGKFRELSRGTQIEAIRQAASEQGLGDPKTLRAMAIAQAMQVHFQNRRLAIVIVTEDGDD